MIDRLGAVHRSGTCRSGGSEREILDVGARLQPFAGGQCLVDFHDARLRDEARFLGVFTPEDEMVADVYKRQPMTRWPSTART